MGDAQKSNKSLTKKELRDVIMNFIIAGRDTTAWACTAMTYLLLKNPKIMSEVDEESRKTFSGQTPTYQELSQLKLLDAVMMESLRLYPSVPADGLFAVEDDVMPDGTKIYGGDGVYYS